MQVPERIRVAVFVPTDEEELPPDTTGEQMMSIVEEYEAHLRYRAVVGYLFRQMLIVLILFCFLRPPAEKVPMLVCVGLLVGSMAHAASLGLCAYAARKKRDRLFA